MLATILSDSVIREGVLSQHDASDILKDAFFRAEASMNNYYEVFPSPAFSSFLCTPIDIFIV